MKAFDSSIRRFVGSLSSSLVIIIILLRCTSAPQDTPTVQPRVGHVRGEVATADEVPKDLARRQGNDSALASADDVLFGNEIGRSKTATRNFE
jgi:hypothetical protein